ncbi:MAG: agmatinase [Deltaproteobacteria bacterium]|nr:agmatinase [Deltaproteobacteria bacterium]
MHYLASKHTGTICILGMPFDSTATYRPGARFGPMAIREASHSLETFSPMQEADLEDIDFMDMGDLELPFGNPEPALAIIEHSVSKIVSQGRIPFPLGGEHLISLGCLRAITKEYQGLKIIHLDAHADLRDMYLGQKLSHATVIRRISEIIGLESIRQIGIRSFAREERPLANEILAEPEKIIDWASSSPCYISCDLDILDPSIFPGTGTPEPGGISFQQLIETLFEILRNLRVVGMDVVELAPQLDPSGVSSVVAAKVVRECLIALSPS